MTKKILVVEDEHQIADIISFNLQREGYEVYTCYDGADGFKNAEEKNPDLILLDVMLPHMDGFTVCKELRAKKIEIPIIMLTARGDEEDKVLGLELGADDYITKPFSIKELMARVKANIRRSHIDTPIESGAHSEGLVLDETRYEVMKNNVPLDLSQREYELIKFLMNQPNKVFSREELMQKVWNFDYYGDLRTVDVTVRRLREKIENNAAEPEYILTKRGVGYYFKK